MRAKQVQVRLEPELRDKLAAEAECQRRPLASLIRNILEDAVAKPAERQQEAVQ
jgi:predicted HicB family RNase H-like nuclease